MIHVFVYHFPILIYFFGVFTVPTWSHVGMVDGGAKILNVGEELWKESMKLQMGTRLYHLQGLKSFTWYEVKISYPASIPASFSLQLKKGNLDLVLNRNRRLLNTEKLIFRTDNLDLINDKGGMYVLVTVEPEGVVAIPNVKEREFIIFNIGFYEYLRLVGWNIDMNNYTLWLADLGRSKSEPVCDELLLGIPLEAWWVVILVTICLILALIIPHFLPYNLLLKNGSLQSPAEGVSKES